MRFRTPLLTLCLALAAAAHAADTAPAPVAAPTDPLAGARKLLQAHQYAAAAEDLRKVNATGNADWNNLMGYALRKQPKPDLDASQRFYDTALRINPQHKDALEYSGELALMKGDVATAEARLASLSKLCSSPCEQLDELKKAIAKHKAGGKT